MSKKKVALACDICKNKNYYVPKSIEDRLVIKKFCKTCKTHEVHKEEK